LRPTLRVGRVANSREFREFSVFANFPNLIKFSVLCTLYSVLCLIVCQNVTLYGGVLSISIVFSLFWQKKGFGKAFARYYARIAKKNNYKQINKRLKLWERLLVLTWEQQTLVLL